MWISQAIWFRQSPRMIRSKKDSPLEKKCRCLYQVQLSLASHQDMVLPLDYSRWVEIPLICVVLLQPCIVDGWSTMWGDLVILRASDDGREAAVTWVWKWVSANEELPWGFEETNRLSLKIGPNSPNKEMKSSSSPIDFSASRLAVAVALFSGGVTFNQSAVEFLPKRIHSHHRKQRGFWPFKMPILMSFPSWNAGFQNFPFKKHAEKNSRSWCVFLSLCHFFSQPLTEHFLI